MTIIEKVKELFEEKEFHLGTCWECDPTNEYLKDSNDLYNCTECGRWFFSRDYLHSGTHNESEYKEK